MDSIPTAELADAAPRPASSKLLAAATLSFLTLSLVGVLVTRGRFLDMLGQMELELPLVTELALGPVVFTSLTIMLLATLVKEFIPICQGISNRWNAIALALGLGIVALYAVGLITPLLKMVQALS